MHSPLQTKHLLLYKNENKSSGIETMKYENKREVNLNMLFLNRLKVRNSSKAINKMF